MIYFEISTSARYEQYKIKCLQKGFTRSLMELNNILKKEFKYFVAKQIISKRGNLFVYEVC